MTDDPVDFVRQGAYISLAMILIQQNEPQSPKVNQIRDLLAKVVSDKHEDPMARFGASLAQGIIDAGGRNMTISLSTRAGTLNMGAIVGLTMFVQFWYWFPLAHCLGLAFSPTVVVAVDEELRIPKVDLTCHGRQSALGYPVREKKEKGEVKGKQKAAVLSTTVRAKAREKRKKEEEGDGMDVVSLWS
jgi:26S proteasome regulatory subunit N2